MNTASSPRYAMPLSVGNAAPYGNGNLARTTRLLRGQPPTHVLPMAATPATADRLHQFAAGIYHRALKMAPTPEELELIDRVKANVLSWIVIAGIAGIGYIAYTVPRQLDTILSNQANMREVDLTHAAQLAELRAKVTLLERSIITLGGRP